MSRPLRVAFLLLHDVVEHPLLSAYGRLYNQDVLELFTLAKSRNAVQTQSELAITPHWNFAARPPFDAIVLGGGFQCYQKARRDKVVRLYLQEALTPLRHIIAVEEAVLLLGYLGLLRDRTVAAPSLSQPLNYADVLAGYNVGEIQDKDCVQDGRLWTVRGEQASSLIYETLLALAETHT